MQYIDLESQYKALKPAIDAGIQNVLDHADFIIGHEVDELEERLAAYTGMKHAVTCSSGTAALQLIYMAYGIGAGDAVFCPDMTFIASIEPAVMLGATPVFADIDKVSYNLDPVDLERQIQRVHAEGKLTPKAVVAVDFLGNPADFDRIRKVTEQYDLLLIEDAAQGMGGAYHGRKCCSLGDVAATSFFPTKPLGCYGDGGCVFTNDDDMDRKLRSLRVHGKGKSKYDNVRIGINSRLDSIQAAVLLAKLDHLDEEIGKRQEIAACYNDALGSAYQTPVIAEDCTPAYAQYVIGAGTQQRRDAVRQSLADAGVPTIMYYPNPLHRLPVFAGAEHYDDPFTNATEYADTTLGIPFAPYMSDEDREAVRKALAEAAAL